MTKYKVILLNKDEKVIKSVTIKATDREHANNQAKTLFDKQKNAWSYDIERVAEKCNYDAFNY